MVLTYTMSVCFIHTIAHSRVTTSLSVPRFASIKTTKARMRVGPGTKYRTSYIYCCQHLPVQIIAEFDSWRKIKDIHNNQGWMHQSLLSEAKYVTINDNKILYKKSLEKNLSKSQLFIFKSPDENSRPVLKIDLGTIAKNIKCRDNWCKVKINKYIGWVRKINIWGTSGIS